MKLYLAAPWADRKEMEARAHHFELYDHVITWKWWNTDDILERSGYDSELALQATHDVKGVLDADIVVLFNTSKSEGKAFEQGVAVTSKKPILAIGKLGDGTSANVFHYLPNYHWVPDIEGAVKSLDTINWLLNNAS